MPVIINFGLGSELLYTCRTELHVTKVIKGIRMNT